MNRFKRFLKHLIIAPHGLVFLTIIQKSYKTSFLPLLLIFIAVCYGNVAYSQESMADQNQNDQNQKENTLPDRKEDSREWAMERLMRISGHKIGGHFGAGIIPSVGNSPWTKGDPSSGIAWQVEYEWIPKKPAYANLFGLPLTVGLGAIYTGYRSSGDDRAYYSGADWDSHMSLMVNYLGVEGTLKLLTRSDRWTFNFRYSIGAMSSSFHGDVAPLSSQLAPFSFTSTKFGFAYGGRFNVDYNLSRHVSIALGFSAYTGFISQPLYHADFDVYPGWPAEMDNWTTLGAYTIGVSYRF